MRNNNSNVNRKEATSLIRELREACRRPLFEEIVLSESKCGALAEAKPGDDNDTGTLTGGNQSSPKTAPPPPERSASSGMDVETASQTSSTGRKERQMNKKSWQEVRTYCMCWSSVSCVCQRLFNDIGVCFWSHTSFRPTANVRFSRPTTLLDRRRTRTGTSIFLDSLVGLLPSLFDGKRVCFATECTP